MNQPIVRFVAQQRNIADCGIAALAMCLGIEYSEALVLVASVVPRVLTTGATWQQLRRAARRHGARFKVLTKNIDVDNEDLCGILGVSLITEGEYEHHAVYLTRGLIFDGRTESVWESDVYLRTHNADITSLMVRVA